MARTGLFALFCAGALFGASSTAFPAPGDDPEQAIKMALAVQGALQQGHEYLLRGNYPAAVAVLESQLARIDGNREYLSTLASAYRGYLKELRLANREAEAQVYLRRLAILDPVAAAEFRGDVKPASANPLPVPVRTAAAGTPSTPAAATRPAPAETARPATVVRAKEPDASDESAGKSLEARSLAQKAEQEFLGRRYDSAGRLYEQAYQADHAITASCGDQWAYCKMHAVVEKLNQPAAGAAAAPELEREVRVAMALSPRLDDFGKDLLQKIQDRRAAGPGKDAGTGGEAPFVTVRQLPAGSDGWAVAETTNFRVYHRQKPELAEQAVRIAEKTRVDMLRKWFGDLDPEWNPKCEIRLHLTAEDYTTEARVPPDSPGHSTLLADGGRLVGRRIDLHCDDPNMLTGVLPHETTHVVLAGRFVDQPVPRWADEGMAVLSEPRPNVDRHLRMIPQYNRDGQLFQPSSLIQMKDYPEARSISVFYAESVSLVDFLVNQKGPQAFTLFLREGQRYGYEAALKRSYNYKNFHELEQSWNQYALRDGAAAAGYAQGSR